MRGSEIVQRRFRVGLVVLVALFAFAIGVFMVGKRASLFTRKVDYEIRFASASGPDRRATPCGSPASRSARSPTSLFRRSPATRPSPCQVSVERRMTSRIRVDSRASIKTIGLLGDKYIELEGGSAGSPEIPPGGEIAAAPGGGHREAARRRRRPSRRSHGNRPVAEEHPRADRKGEGARRRAHERFRARKADRLEPQPDVETAFGDPRKDQLRQKPRRQADRGREIRARQRTGALDRDRVRLEAVRKALDRDGQARRRPPGSHRRSRRQKEDLRADRQPLAGGRVARAACRRISTRGRDYSRSCCTTSLSPATSASTSQTSRRTSTPFRQSSTAGTARSGSSSATPPSTTPPTTSSSESTTRSS